VSKNNQGGTSGPSDDAAGADIGSPDPLEWERRAA
jgi:hypothetical protein